MPRRQSMAHRDFVYDPPLIPFLDVLYEDDDIIVVNKPSTILSVPGKLKIHRDSIMTRVKSIHPDAFVVHRLDYGTSGVLVLGLNKSAISNLGKQFIARGVHKVYVAWVAGKLEGTGAVDLPLILDLEHRPFQKVDFGSYLCASVSTDRPLTPVTCAYAAAGASDLRRSSLR